ncbi:hypothetical protein OIDMADRAFT_35808 [Oidiodendron maius Zn]|uniref:Uncharacterized protein n=1 Tax=Oidiodendron maius (strain Zn) TaxID=913774 RepID=A0A0C3CUB8_OIDMZ|nr:hypothetical protein OIDMADRAFT_35808 [Oidiodendron maius Zn]
MHLGLPYFLLISENFVEPDEDGTPVRVLTTHGLLNGHLSRPETYVHLSNSSSYQEVYVGDFDSPVPAGNCGAVVYDALWRGVFGHIITGSTSPTRSAAFIMPAKHVHEDIIRRLDIFCDIGTHRLAGASRVLANSVLRGPGSAEAKLYCPFI